MQEDTPREAKPLENLTFVLTGPEKYSRSQAKEIIENLGGRVSTVLAKTDTWYWKRSGFQIR